MSEERVPYRGRGAISEAQQALTELSEHYAMIPDDLLQAGNPSAITIYGAIDRAARGDKTEVEVAFSYLARFAQMSATTVQNAVRWLEDKVEVVLAGQRLRDRYELVQTSQEKREWLLFKKA